MARCIWTIGHSTRSMAEFLALLNAHHIQCVADVRAFPYSRRYPHFNTDELAACLGAQGLAYVSMKGLGGRRAGHRDTVNTGWRNAGFRGYADYMQTDGFWRALEELGAVAESMFTAVMCAEAVPWRCHRTLIADALVSKGWRVKHILSGTKAEAHAMTSFAVVEDGRLTYPPPADPRPRLF